MDLSCATVGETSDKWLNHLENLFLFGNEDTDGVNLESLGGFTVKGFKSSQILDSVLTILKHNRHPTTCNTENTVE